MTTTNDIAAIRKLTDATTDGPWVVGEAQCTDEIDAWEVPLHAEGPVADLAVLRYQTNGFQFPHAEVRADAEFIATARTLVPALCDEVEQLTAERDLNNDLLDGTAKALGLDLDYAHVHHEVPAKVAELVAALTQSRQQAATYANEIGALKADLERTRAELATADIVIASMRDAIDEDEAVAR